jgi:hypothetical protein
MIKCAFWTILSSIIFPHEMLIPAKKYEVDQLIIKVESVLKGNHIIFQLI